jgi:hypothetical protein
MGMGVVSTSYEYGWSGGCSPRRVQFGTSEQAAAGAAAAGACRVRPSPGLPGEVPWAVEWAGARSRAAGDPTGETVGHRAAARSQIFADPTQCRRRSTDKQETSDFYLFRTE